MKYRGMIDRLQCHICGRITAWNSDESTNFGTSYDLEPPDPDFYCKRCAKQMMQEAVKTKHLPAHWIPARWEYRAAKKIGFVRMNPKGAAWGNWVSPEGIDALKCGGWTVIWPEAKP